MRMKSVVTVFLILMSPLSAFAADDILPVLVVSGDEYFWMVQGQDGRPAIFKFSAVVVLKRPQNPPDTPEDPDTPQDPPKTEFGLKVQVKQWLATVNRTAIGSKPKIVLALSNAVDAAKSGKFKTIAEMESALGAALSVAIEDKAAWAGFGASLQSAISVLKSSEVGKISTPQDLGRALNEVVEGLK